MKIYYTRKLKNRKYDSRDLAAMVLSLENIQGLALLYDEKGKPFLVTADANGEVDAHETTTGNSGGYQNSSVPFVSITHTRTLWAMALSKHGPVGIDAEEQTRPIKASAQKRLHPLEQKYLSGLTAGTQEWKAEFIDIWTRKEAYMKYVGDGLRLGLSKFSVVEGDLSFSDICTCKGKPEGHMSSVYIAGGITTAACSSAVDEAAVLEFKAEGKAEKPAGELLGDMLAQRDYTEAELIKKLMEKGAARSEAEEAIARAKERGYVNDMAFAQRLAAKAVENGKGKRRIMYELQRKGISPMAAREAFPEAESESQRAWAVARKLMGYPEEPEEGEALPTLSEKELARLGRKLSSLGYEASVIYGILERLRP